MSREENKKLKFIYNPLAGRAQITSKLSNIIETFVQNGYDVSIYPTQKYKDMVEQVEALEDCYDLLVVSGGDGTLDEVVTGLMEIGANVPLGYIPAGSTNDFASSLEIPRDMVKAAQDIVDGHLFSVDVGSFNEDNFIYVAAFGMFTDVSYETSQDLKNILGHLAYVMEGAKRIFDVKTYHLCVEANGEVHEGDYIYGMITNSHSIGGFRNLVGNDVEMDDGLFEVTLIKKPKNPLELNEIIAALINAYDDTDMIDAFKANSLYIHGDEAISWTLDGEFGGEHKEVRIKNRKQALDILINS